MRKRSSMSGCFSLAARYCSMITERPSAGAGAALVSFGGCAGGYQSSTLRRRQLLWRRSGGRRRSFDLRTSRPGIGRSSCHRFGRQGRPLRTAPRRGLESLGVPAHSTSLPAPPRRNWPGRRRQAFRSGSPVPAGCCSHAHHAGSPPHSGSRRRCRPAA